MTFSVMWTALPDGYTTGGTTTLQLSLMASPRITDLRSSLGDSPLLSWPQFVADLPDLFVQAKGSTALIPATKVGPAPDLDLWHRMFSGTTKVITRGGQDLPPQITASPGSLVRAGESLRAVRRAAAEQRTIDQDGRVRVAGRNAALDIVRAIHGLDSAPAAERRRGESLQQEISRLRAAGDENAALAAPFAAYARAFRTRPASDRSRAARPLATVPQIQFADFHQVLGLLLAHPHLARAVGLRLDLTIPAFEGPRSIRVVGPDGQPINGDKPIPQPFSRVEAVAARRRFTMAAGPGPAPEVVGGMLAVRGDPDYMVTTADVVAQSLQLVAQSTAMASAAGRAGAVGPDPDDSLPARSDLGVTIARRDRPAAVIAPSLQRSATLHHTLTTQPPTTDALELFADDVTSGFRLDVSRNGGPFRSLMTRQVRTTVGTRALPAVVDEGRIEAFTGVEQPDEDGIPQLTAGEEVASWDGWSIAVPRPGLKVETAPGAPANAAAVPPVTMPGYGVRTEISAVPGTVERLRFGDALTFRLRSVDLAGNSPAPDAVDPTQVLPTTRYLRTQGASSPTIVLRRRYTEGESLHHLVVRSVDGEQDGPAAERHLAPPNVSQALAERHGMFDRALGNRGNQGVRDEMLAIARREAGSFLDPTVPGPDGVLRPAVGIAVVTNDPTAPPPITLPIPRGEPLPNGAYVIHDTDHPRLPYLADPVVEGASLIGVPGSIGPVVAPYGGTGWPDVQPIRLVVRPTTKARPDPSAEVVDDRGRSALVLHVPPGFDGTVELSSSIRANLIPHLDTQGTPTKVVVTGQLPEISPRQQLSIVHAVRVPAQAPSIVGQPTITAVQDAASYTGTATVATHAPTTAQVDVEATWTERSDPGAGELVEDARVMRIGSATVEKSGTGTVTVPLRHVLGDGRHRRITLTPWATTRFREYYPPVADGDRSRQRPAAAGTPVSVKNRNRPTPPVVDSVLPLFAWTRKVLTSGPFTGLRSHERKTVGLRVRLRRPWLASGEGELLGVLVHTDTPPTGLALTRLQGLVSRWGGDPLEDRPPAPPEHLLATQFTDEQQVTSCPLDQAGNAGVKVLGYPVQFDADRDMWFSDVLLAVTAEPWPFVRLGLVRYQPESIAGAEISRAVLTDFAQLPPNRQVIYSRVGTLGIRAQVLGVGTRNSTYTIRQERFMPDPFDPTTGLASDGGVGKADGWTVTEGPTGGNLRADLTLTRASSPGGTVLTELEAGRIVVEEKQRGLALLDDTTADRVVFTDTVLRKDI